MVLVAVPLVRQRGGARACEVVLTSALAAAVLFFVSPVLGHPFPGQVMFDFLPPPGISDMIYMNVYLFPYGAGATLPMAVIYGVLGGVCWMLFRGSNRRRRLFLVSFWTMHLAYLFVILWRAMFAVVVPVRRFPAWEGVYEVVSGLETWGIWVFFAAGTVFVVGLVWPGRRVEARPT